MALADVFKQVETSLGGLLSGGKSKSSDSVIGLDIGSSSLKIVQLRTEKGTAILETYGELALGPYSQLEVGQATNLPAEKLAEALTDIVREANVTAKEAGVSIPLSASLISTITLPTKDPKELAKIIPIEARKYIPVPISEVALDWFILPEDDAKFLGTPSSKEGGANKSDVLLVAIHNDILAKFQKTLDLGKLTASFFEIETFSTMRAVLEQNVAPVVIIDMGSASTKICVVEFGIVQMSHTLPKGSQDITLALARSLNLSMTEAETMKRDRGIEALTGTSQEAMSLTLDYLMTEANRVVINYQKRSNKAVSEVIFSGGGSALKGLLEYAQKHFEVPLRRANPFAKTEVPAFIGETLKEAGPTFSVAVGLALRKLRERA
jgi:type IV pilus assembly protein PilM